MAHSFQGPQPARRAFDIPAQPQTSNPFHAMLGRTTSRPATAPSPAGGEFTGFGRVGGETGGDEGTAHRRVPDAERVPGADRRRGREEPTGTEDRSEALGGGGRDDRGPPRRDDGRNPPAGAGAAPRGGTGTAGEDVNVAILQLLDKVADKVNASSNPAARSTTRIKFPDFKASKFDGDPMNFLPWIMEFTEMLRLDEHLGGHAKLTLLKMHLTAAVKTELNFTTSDTMSYESCLELLIGKYGRPVQIRRAYRRKITELPAPVSNSDYKGLDRLCRETKQLLNALHIIGQTTAEIGVTVVDALLDKLPERMYAEVIRFTFNNTTKDPSELDISDLLMVLEKFAQLQEDVDHRNRNRGRGRDSREQRGGNQQPRRNQRAESTTEHRQTTMVTTGEGAKTNVPYCALCQSREHWADGCKKYGTPKQRRERFIELKLCFKCAKPHPGGVRDCTSTWKCGARTNDSRCTRNHHIALHDYYSTLAPAGPPQGGDQVTGRGRSTSPSQRVRFVDDRTESGNGCRRE